MKTSNLKLYIAENKYFDTIFSHIEKEFPPEERKTFDHYKNLLNNTPYDLILLCDKNSTQNDCPTKLFDGKNHEILGFSLVYLLKEQNILWGDYLAILDGYKNKGYGSYIYQNLVSLYENNNFKIQGMFFEVEKPTGQDINQQRRINLYERLGAKRLLDNYILPEPNYGLDMYFYYMPFYPHTLNADTIKNSIRTVHDSIHHDIAHKDSLYSKYFGSIRNIKF